MPVAAPPGSHHVGHRTLAGKLTAAQDNDAKSWLPASAESTEVLTIASSFASPNTIPAVIVYVRESGLTP